eukprot:CAMPEP_0173380496 /NCGR_PEP_ID=MMETSP1356-20130122/3175_1 /TAXON_ID=77927 ORGANISM="Hemiselmis virescens, Strain PCC157" /NCGR_SAMPLE_ID=MMETSP1356 /ASSEMBLY_ACC=CAM_ASM_000847 /LENGTH=39 /DNA_ID= /DNA_START= /DNA_END= /DNA_ORIENTATION=
MMHAMRLDGRRRMLAAIFPCIPPVASREAPAEMVPTQTS